MGRALLVKAVALAATAATLVGAQLDCPTLTPTPIPDNAADLDVTNFRVLAAMGDSITTGYGIINNFDEIHGEVFSIGGESGRITLPNILRAQNPNITGASTNNDDGFNVAESGAKAEDMPDQAEELVDRLRGSNAIDFDEDWKLVTLWIGGNDICDHCDDSFLTANNYEQQVGEALQILYDEVPRIVVNLITQFDFSQMNELSQGRFCRFIAGFACGCAITNNQQELDDTDAYCQSLNDRMRVLTDTFNGYARSDFGVILQTINIDAFVENEEMISSADCFHPTRFAHERFAINVYNELLKPASQKSTALDLDDPEVQCATDNNKRVYIG